MRGFAGFASLRWICMIVSVGACDVFQPRDPEPPSQSSSNYLPPTEPPIVFTNMVNAFRDLNSVNYIRSFSDTASSGRSFQFEPNPQSRLRYGGVFLNWTKQSEQQYFENIRSRLASGTSPVLVFESLSAQSIQSDSAQYEATYRFTVPHTQQNIPTEARGRAQFFMLADKSRNWVIWRWVDIQINQNTFSWSDFKGEFGQ